MFCLLSTVVSFEYTAGKQPEGIMKCYRLVPVFVLIDSRVAIGDLAHILGILDTGEYSQRQTFSLLE